MHKLTKRIDELRTAARRARLEAMQLAAKLLTTSNAELADAPPLPVTANSRHCAPATKAW